MHILQATSRFDGFVFVKDGRQHGVPSYAQPP